MTGVPTFETKFLHQVGSSVQLMEEGPGRYRVSVPFTFNDGDVFIIILKQIGSNWVFSDEGHTYMHLAYSIEASRLLYGTRRQMIVQALQMFQVQERGAELVLPVHDNDYADALWSFVQALLKIVDVTYLTQERVRSTFLEDFQTFFETMIAPDRRTFEWYDPEHDPDKRYVVDCRFNGLARPLFIYALANDDRVRDATIGIAYFIRTGFKFYSVGIFEDQTIINRHVLARFTDICDRQFPNLSSSRELIEKFLIAALRGELPAMAHGEQADSEEESDRALLFAPHD